jgi:hypothetical protein
VINQIYKYGKFDIIHIGFYKVGSGIAKNIDKKRFVICHSFSQVIQVKLSYLIPIKLGKFMNKMTANVKDSSKEQNL